LHGSGVRRAKIRVMSIASTKQVVPLDSPQFIDFLALEYHKAVAARMRVDPDRIIEKACGNLKRWLSDYPPGSSDARCLEEWVELLETRAVSELIAIITQDSDEGQRLRSSTPFTGILSVQEREEIYNRCAEMATSLFAVTDIVPSIVSRSIEADFLLGPHGPEVMHQVGKPWECAAISSINKVTMPTRSGWRPWCSCRAGAIDCNRSETKPEKRWRNVSKFMIFRSAN
jgi:hypothetical protein